MEKYHKRHCERSVAILQSIFFNFIFGLFALTSIFVVLPKTHAAEKHDVIINEIMWSGSNTDTTDEWLELKNLSSVAINFTITPWSIYKNGSLMVKIDKGLIEPNGYYLIARKSIGSILAIPADLYSSSISLNNTNVQYKLYDTADSAGNVVDIADDGSGVPFTGSNVSGSKTSMERNETVGDGALASSWHSAIYAENLIDLATEKATPGTDNSKLLPPDPSGLIAPLNNTVFIGIKSVDFEWSEVVGPTYSLIISKNSDLSDPVIGESLLDWGKFYWAVEAKENGFTSLSEIWSFELQKPIYSKKIIINEILSHPSTGVNSEFIELYNSGDVAVDLSGWFLDDMIGGSNPYTIPEGTTIGSKGYLIFYKSQTGLSLNDTGDMARLMNPDNEIASEITFSEAEIDLAWARGPGGVWSWTTTVTPGALNIITAPITDPPPIEETEPVINTVPIEIATGDYENYLDKLVKIKGKVTSTSGSTFYIDDGSGVIKVYIQSKTGIKKPEMHKNDIFEIIGIVDIYGLTWRILPIDQDDIKLIELAAKVSTKKTTVKKVTAEVKAATLSPVLSTAKAAETNSSDQVKDKNDTFNQLVKLIIVLALIVFVIFFVRIWNRREKSIGGHFGDDET